MEKIKLYGLVLFATLIWGGCTKVKDVYEIESVKITKVALVLADNGYKIVSSDIADSLHVAAFGIGLTCKKHYYSSAHARTLLFNSIEPGYGGIDNKIKSLNIYLWQADTLIPLNDLLICYDIHVLNSNSVSFLQKPADSVSLTKFIFDINHNERYTTGIRLDDNEKYFWLPPQYKILNDSIKLIFQDQQKGIVLTSF